MSDDPKIVDVETLQDPELYPVAQLEKAVQIAVWMGCPRIVLTEPPGPDSTR